MAWSWTGGTSRVFCDTFRAWAKSVGLPGLVIDSLHENYAEAGVYYWLRWLEAGIDADVHGFVSKRSMVQRNSAVESMIASMPGPLRELSGKLAEVRPEISLKLLAFAAELEARA